MAIEIFEDEGAKPSIELSVSDGRGVDIEEEERGTFLEVDSDRNSLS